MGIIFSRQCEYALQAVLYIALKPQGEMTSIKELTLELDVPYYFLAKILQNLTREKMLISQKGPAGGFALNISAGKITLSKIIEAIDGEGFMHNCVFGFPDCSGANPCAAHDHWAKIRDEIRAMLISRTIQEMANDTRKPHYKKSI